MQLLATRRCGAFSTRSSALLVLAFSKDKGVTKRVFTEESVTNDLRRLFVRLQAVEEEAKRNKREVQKLQGTVERLKSGFSSYRRAAESRP